MELVDWSTVTQLKSRPFDEGTLKKYLELVGDPGPLIRAGLRSVPPSSWTAGSQSIVSTFGLDRLNHCFHLPPHDWSRFHEPQITAGFAHYLGSGPWRTRVSRALSFAKAASRSAGRDPAFLDRLDVQATRCVAEENRTDILLELRTKGRRIGVSVEAKFGHQLTKGQLPKALCHARDGCGWDLADTTLLVVAPDADVLDGPVMRRNWQFGWRAASWWSLLSNLERYTDPEHDCDDYRRFRRTVWHRAY